MAEPNSITPGPWVYDRRPKMGSINNCEIRTEATVQHTETWSGPSFIGCVYNEADAKLVIEAPRMLDLLQRLVRDKLDDAVLGEAQALVEEFEAFEPHRITPDEEAEFQTKCRRELFGW